MPCSVSSRAIARWARRFADKCVREPQEIALKNSRPRVMRHFMLVGHLRVCGCHRAYCEQAIANVSRARQASAPTSHAMPPAIADTDLKPAAVLRPSCPSDPSLLQSRDGKIVRRRRFRDRNVYSGGRRIITDFVLNVGRPHTACKLSDLDATSRNSVRAFGLSLEPHCAHQSVETRRSRTSISPTILEKKTMSRRLHRAYFGPSPTYSDGPIRRRKEDNRRTLYSIRATSSSVARSKVIW